MDLRYATRAAGPGIVSAASDNDPTTIASLAVIGSTTVYGLLWLVVLLVPMLVVTQTVGARVGTVARRGLEDLVRLRYGRAVALLMMLLVLGVNLFTLAADLDGGAAALGLLFHTSATPFVVPLAVLVGAFLMRGRFARIERVLQYVLLGYAVYLLAAVLARPDWSAVLRATVTPRLHATMPFVDGAVALLGTTLTSYAYVWETISTARRGAPLRRLGTAQIEAGAGMVGAGVLFFAIVVTSGATLGRHHQTVRTAADAARALRPLAGGGASALFGVGLLASALLALPVLAGTTAYVLAEAVGWKRDLDARFGEARAFYVAISLALAIGAILALVVSDPVALLFDSSVAAGLATPFTLALMMRAAGDRRVMGDFPVATATRLAGWAVVAIVTAACVAFLVTTFT